MNDVFVMVVLIVGISVGAGVYRDYLKSQRAISRNAEADEDLLAELAALRKRVAVLEEIVTDRKYQLNQELEQL